MPHYICPRYPELRIRHLRFLQGHLQVDDDDAAGIALVEGNELWKVKIFPMSTDPATPGVGGMQRALAEFQANNGEAERLAVENVQLKRRLAALEKAASPTVLKRAAALMEEDDGS